MATIRIRRLADGQVFEGPAEADLPDGFVIDSAGEKAPPQSAKPSFWETLGSAAKERAGEIGQFPGYVAGRVAKDATDAYNSLPDILSMLPGLQGAVGAGLGHLEKNRQNGEPFDLGGAATDAAVVGVLGQAGKILRPLSKLRIAGTGKAKDAALAAEAVRGARTPLQPTGATDLMDTMRGTRGAQAIGAATAAGEDAIAAQLPPRPARIDTSTRAYLDAQVAGHAPVQAPEPPLSREAYRESTADLTKLGRQGFGLRGAARDTPQATAAREQYGESLAKLKADLTEQGGQGLLDQELARRRDVSAGNELRRLFRPNTGEGPDRVFRPNGFNLQDLQERAGKRVQEIQSRLGPEAGDAFLKKIYRGGAPGQGTDRPLQISGSKFGGFRIPLGLEILAGPGMDPRLLQALMQGGGAGLLGALEQ